ncbi:DUF515 domain-containing protein [Wolbachia pipientis]|uniref:DUF515 domain-containing protein n=1 Tax=Wolbachia pipientis TaxID=955 RepID=UPI002030E5EB|nr:DUF515 domain-containing protein [Wolbachia pipientis]
MKNFPGENGNLSDNSIFKACIREADLALQEKLQKIQGAADELARQAIIDKLKQAEVEYEKLKLKLEQEASDGVKDILSHVELSAAENEDNFTNGIDGLLAKLFKFFNFMDSELGVETGPQVYNMIKKREEEEKQAWVAAVIKFLRDKFNKLIKAIFSRDLSFQQKIDKEIKELYEKLFSGGLSQEEEVAILERLEALRDLKLKLQIFVVGSIIAMFAELFSVELTASVETAKEEGKEKASAKEVRENLEIKVDAKEKPQLKYDVIPALDAESWLKKPITLTKQEHDLLPKPLKDILPPVPKDDMNKGNGGGPKQEVERKQENENKKPTQPPQKPNVAAPPEKAPGKVPGAGEIAFDSRDVAELFSYEKRKFNANNGVGGMTFTNGFNVKYATSDNNCSTISSVKKDFKSTNGQKADSPYAKLAAKVAERKAQKEKSAASIKHDYPIDHFQVPVGTNGKSHASGRNEPQQSSVKNAQPKSECSSVKINNHVESIGKAPEEVSSRGSRTM